MPIDPKTGKHLPYPGEPGYKPPETAPGMDAPTTPVKRRGPGGRPPERQRPQGRSLGARPAQAGPPLMGEPAGLGQYGSLGAVPGVGQAGAVNPHSVMPQPRRRGLGVA